MNVKDVMTSEPACCMPETSLVEVARMMVECDCGEIPVIASGTDRRPIGVITDRDIVIRTLADNINPLEKSAVDCMTTPVVTVTPDCDLSECCDLMETHKIRRVPVVDDRGNLVGIVAQADIALSAGRRATAEVVKEVSQPAGSSRH
jgi:CBS domain-containing protein